MSNTNIDLQLKNDYDQNSNHEFSHNINMQDLGLILRQATDEIENGIKGQNAFEALDEIEAEVFGKLL